MTTSKNLLFGIAIGDALGVPVEFKSREYLKQYPITDMIGFGSYNQEPGTFSDDSSLTFCLAEALTEKFDLHLIALNFIRWYKNNFWTARGRVFDIGHGTRDSIERLMKGTRPDLAGGYEIDSNGNGSLMRILPLLFELENKPIEERFQIVKLVSSLTHGHVRSIISCFYYLEFALKIKSNIEKFEAYSQLKLEISEFLNSTTILESELKLFDRLLVDDIYNLQENDIKSSGYVIDTLEASIWSILTTNSFSEAVLKAINLGKDTDTTGAVTGGLAGMIYSYNEIPIGWLNKLARNKDIEKLANKLETKYASH